METHDVKVGRINDLKGGSLVDQIKLLQLQQKLSPRNREESAPPNEQADRLENIESLLSQMLKELVAIREMLASSEVAEHSDEANNSSTRCPALV